MKYTCEYIIGSHPSFKDFKKEVPELKDIPIPLFRKIIEECGQAFTDRIVKDGDTIKLPLRMGEIGLKGIKSNLMNKHNQIVLPRNEVLCAIKKNLLYYENLHSDRYKYNVIWYKRFANFHNNDIWKFLPNKVNFRYEIKNNIEKGVEYYKKLVQ